MHHRTAAPPDEAVRELMAMTQAKIATSQSSDAVTPGPPGSLPASAKSATRTRNVAWTRTSIPAT